jgi:hypothetical protein
MDGDTEMAKAQVASGADLHRKVEAGCDRAGCLPNLLYFETVVGRLGLAD